MHYQVNCHIRLESEAQETCKTNSKYLMLFSDIYMQICECVNICIGANKCIVPLYNGKRVTYENAVNRGA